MSFVPGRPPTRDGAVGEDSAGARWLIALAMLGALALVGFLLVEEQLDQEHSDQLVVGATGRLRALSLEAVLAAEEVAEAGDAQALAASRAELARVLDAIEETLDGLQGATTVEGRTRNLPPSVVRIYFEEPHHLDARLRAFLAEGRSLADGTDPEVARDDPRIAVMRAATKPIIAGVDEAIEAYAAEAEAAESLIRGFQVWTLATTLLLLGVVAVFVFRPMEQRIRREVAQLRELNATLEARVAARTAEADARSKELARSNADLEQFAYVASHDLQEPLRMVASYMQLLERRYKGRLDDDADEFIGYAVDGARRMQRLIDDLLTFSRVGTRLSTPAPTEADEALDEALRALEFTLGESGAVVTRGPLPRVQADATHLAQLFQNLVSNAIKFRDPDRRSEVHVDAMLEGRLWHFRVRDNGIGIAAEHQERIFQLFQRLHPRDRVAGTGIGLAICKRIVNRHGGTIWVESDGSGKGTTFHFTLAATPEGLPPGDDGEEEKGKEKRPVVHAVARRAEDIV